MATSQLRSAYESLRRAATPVPTNRVETYEQERDRFNRRLRTIHKQPEAKIIKRYRNYLMRRTFNPAGDLAQVSARRARGDEYRRFPDEFQLLNKRMDELGVAPCIE